MAHIVLESGNNKIEMNVSGEVARAITNILLHELSQALGPPPTVKAVLATKAPPRQNVIPKTPVKVKAKPKAKVDDPILSHSFHRDSTGIALLKILTKRTRPVTNQRFRELLPSTGTSAIDNMLSQLHGAHYVERVKMGHYRITELGRKALQAYYESQED